MATITLKHPIIVNDQPITQLTLPDRLKMKHMKAMDAASGEIGKVAALIGAMAELPMAAVDQIDAEDFGAITEAVSGFLAQFPATGGTS
jgi:hypothetical protein